MGRRRDKVKLEDIHLDEDWFQLKKPEANGTKAGTQAAQSEKLIDELVGIIKSKQASKKHTLLDRLALWRNEAGTYFLIDGHHRYEAYQRASIRRAVDVHVYEGIDRHEARRISHELNKKAHRDFTRPERLNAAWEFIRSDDPYYRELTPRKFAAEFEDTPGRSTIERMRAVKETLEADGLLNDPRYAFWRRAQGYSKEKDFEPYDMDAAETKRIGELSVKLGTLLRERDRRNDWHTLREAIAEAIADKFGIEVGVKIVGGPDDEPEGDF